MQTPPLESVVLLPEERKVAGWEMNVIDSEELSQRMKEMNVTTLISQVCEEKIWSDWGKIQNLNQKNPNDLTNHDQKKK